MDSNYYLMMPMEEMSMYSGLKHISYRDTLSLHFIACSMFISIAAKESFETSSVTINGNWSRACHSFQWVEFPVWMHLIYLSQTSWLLMPFCQEDALQKFWSLITLKWIANKPCSEHCMSTRFILNQWCGTELPESSSCTGLQTSRRRDHMGAEYGMFLFQMNIPQPSEGTIFMGRHHIIHPGHVVSLSTYPWSSIRRRSHREVAPTLLQQRQSRVQS